MDAAKQRLTVQIIINPVSGRCGARDRVNGLCKRLRADGHRYTSNETSCPGDAAKFARRAGEEGADRIIVVGGDGTINECIDAAAESGVPMLVIPTGTENLLAKYLRLSGDAEWFYRVLISGRELALNVPRVNGRPILLVCGIGFDAEVVRGVSKARRGHISYMSYFWPTWRTLWTYRHPRVSVECDGETIFTGFGLVFVGNISRYAMGLQILRNADPEDDLMDVCIFPCRWQGSLLIHATNVLLKRHIGRYGVLYRQARRVSVRSDTDVPMEVDGDLQGELPAEFVMSDRRVQLLIPRDWNT